MSISKINAVPHSCAGPHNVKTFMDILRPVIRINQVAGVCPLEISGHNIKFRFRSLKALHTLFTLLILSCYFCYSLYQFALSFGRGRGVPEIVSMATWVVATLLPIAMLILTVLKRHQFSHFFEKSNEFRVPLKGMIRCFRTVRYARKIFIVYIILTIGACFFVVLEVVRKPTRDIFILAYVEDPSPSLIAISCVFQCYLVIVKSCGCAFIEVLCCCIGASFQNTIDSIIDELHEAVGVSSTPVYRKDKSSMDRLVTNTNRTDQHQNFKDSLNNTNVTSDNNNGIMRIPTHPNLSYLNANQPYIVSNPWPCSGNACTCYTPSQIMTCYRKYSLNMSKENKNEEDDGAEPIVIAIKKFNCITSMQSLLNCIFGPILALDIGLLVLVSCLLLYLKINYLGSGSVDFLDGVTFVGNCILYFARLIIVFISLGNVHEVSIHFNECVTTSLMHVKKPSAPEMNLILAHLTSQFANPSCFSAAGFFVFSRGSLLAVLSAIMTYVVFLLQAKM